MKLPKVSKIGLTYLILGFPIVMKGYIGPVIDLVIRLSINYLPVNLKVLRSGKLLYLVFNPPLYVATNYSSSFSGHFLIFSFFYPFLSLFLISWIQYRFKPR
ncbi:MAG: hypothetical protein H0Z28_04930 [Archaeoglobus sp.]|nr:hypothetical protein [Archaeoglobus sp.]